ncbi:methyl-accepting chemotaxis protein [Haliea sp.]|jgi:methyl-accepting chemotaxis protein|uniref:methyl-accepting chemotaxis protein n=1 Tax=Haliea TaxID=475794 RepID=UPI000C38FC00|nr:methyl-accepting chemotaxis protein [Haliea sp.]HAN67618.1 hypothetical protein [Halieaceae bacterium]MAY91949.1 hypothetical protein [Haliea sp.]MBK41873.1 hypothetical protein [Haliea sp.]HBX72619.1 hypothetical protein [Halieaceae bacterium]HCD56066.1 hypothetical protein [Halieaceae bacterium]|tara:strand:+ start:8160 stop:9269 length:1110 start_codon:yes stop_codon:yes gene_type:complete
MSQTVLLVVVIVLLIAQGITGFLLWQARRGAGAAGGADEGVLVALRRLADGDLTARAESAAPATAAIAEQLNTALSRQRELVSELRVPFEGLAAELHKLGKNSLGHSETSAGMGRQLEEVKSALSREVQAAEDMTSISKQAREAMGRHRQLVSRGQTLATDMARASSDVRESMQETSKSAKRQGELIQSVTTAAEYIQSLNTRISVVAINTRIEAERAGEHGRPFLGIAEAIGDLLREAEEEGRKITSEVRMLQNLSAENLNSLEHTVGAVVTILEFVERIDASLEDINHGAAYLLDQVDSLGNTTQQSADTVRRLHGLLGEVREQNRALREGAEATQQGIATLQQTLSTLGRNLARLRVDSAGSALNV